MPRYVAFLRGVSPLNAKMSELKTCFEKAGFTDVVTVLSSGNVVFGARAGSESALEKKIEKAVEKDLGKTFQTIVKSQEELREMLELDPYRNLQSSPKAKRVVTFLKAPSEKKIKLPIRQDGVHVFSLEKQTVYSTYDPHPKGPVFMTLLEKTFGKSVTTRTWDTIGKVAKK